MAGPGFFAFISNAAPQIRACVLESLLLELDEATSGKPVLLEMDHESRPRFRTGQPSRDDPIARYGNTLASSGAPVLKPGEAADFLGDAVKVRNAPLSEGRMFISLLDDAPPAEAMPMFDALCYAVPVNTASVSFVYKAVKEMETAGLRLPIRVLVLGEPAIEKAAEFYLSLANELKLTGKGFSTLSYAGFLAFDPEEANIAAQYGVLTVEAFPQGSTRGQARLAAQKTFARDYSESSDDWVAQGRAFIKYLRPVK